MPRKPMLPDRQSAYRKPMLPAHQAKRIKLRHTVTLDPETVERCARIQAAVPELDGLSATLRYAARITDEIETKKQEKRR